MTHAFGTGKHLELGLEKCSVVLVEFKAFLIGTKNKCRIHQADMTFLYLHALGKHVNDDRVRLSAPFDVAAATALRFNPIRGVKINTELPHSCLTPSLHFCRIANFSSCSELNLLEYDRKALLPSFQPNTEQPNQRQPNPGLRPDESPCK